jgi:trans-2,3-dihydro-3-hydroxyanthranilate isomerase
MPSFHRFHTLDVFTDRRFGGNPLAVFEDGQGISAEVMQQIAREMNLSETVFVLPPTDSRALCRLRIFTPGRELQFAGHPTVGSGHLLATLGRIPLREERTTVLLEEGVGLVPLTVVARNGQPSFVQLSVAALPTFGAEPPSNRELAALLGIDEHDILSGADAPASASCGLPFLLVPVRDRQVLARISLDVARAQRALADYWAKEIFLFSRDPELPGSSIRARMFMPPLGGMEDPATGSACAALGGYLGVREARATATLRWTVEQGFEMGRPSLIHLETDKVDGRITAVRVGGNSVLVSEGKLRLD